MKKILLLIPAVFLLNSCFQQERKCADFKTGKFRFEYEIEGAKKVTLFERSDSLEVETFEGKTDTSTVRWINDCEYILQKVNAKNAKERKAVHMKILTTKDNSYTFEFSLVGETQKQKGTVTKIN